MKVGYLKQRLAAYPDDFDVIIARDSEGNSHSPLANVGAALYVAETTWHGEIRATEDELPMGQLNVVVLEPTY